MAIGQMILTYVLAPTIYKQFIQACLVKSYKQETIKQKMYFVLLNQLLCNGTCQNVCASSSGGGFQLGPCWTILNSEH